MVASSEVLRPSLSLNVKSKMLLRANVIFDVTCSWILSNESCVTFKDDLRFEVKAAVKLFVTKSDRSELWSDLRIANSIDVMLKFVFVNVSFAFSSVCGPGRRVKLISDSTK